MAGASSTRAVVATLAAISVVLLGVRLYAAAHVGFGDSEALYAAYALHPQPAYLDHPGLVGTFARLLGGGTAPDPLRAHLVTAVLATGFPWILALACRACGARWAPSLATALAAAVAPEIAVGLFAMTPDLLLAYAWTAAIALAAVALRSPPQGGLATFAFAGAGLLAGVATASKITGGALFVALVAAYAFPAARAHARTIAPWAGLAAGLLVVVPIVAFEAHAGWPMLRHRLVDSQPGAGLSLRNAGALVGGQLVYLSPVIAYLAVLAARATWRGRSDDAVGRLLAAALALPLAGLVPLCLWSRVAEPHWMAPPLLAAAMGAARSAPPIAVSRRLYVTACAVAGVLVAGVHAWILVPSAVALAPASYDARVDISNELRGWPEAIAAVREEVASVPPDLAEIVVAGPHWVVCAQLEAALRDEPRVGCDTPSPDDFDRWLPRARWQRADVVVWVDDGRFPPPALPAYVAMKTRRVEVTRAGRVVRTFVITLLSRVAQG